MLRFLKSKTLASFFAHALSSYAVGKTFPGRHIGTKILALGALSSILPDADILAFRFGIHYEHMFGHRGFTHSITFALIWSILLIFVFHGGIRSRVLTGLYYFICTISHGILDAMTTGGRGVAFFAPFSEERFFLPWRFIRVSPLEARDFFSEWGIRVIQNEIVFVGIPCVILIVLGRFLNKFIYKP